MFQHSFTERTVPVPVSVPGKRFRRFWFRVRFLRKRFRRFRFPVSVRFLRRPARKIPSLNYCLLISEDFWIFLILPVIVVPLHSGRLSGTRWIFENLELKEKLARSR